VKPVLKPLGRVLLALVILSSSNVGATAATTAEDMVVHPFWTRRPSADDLRRLYPKQVRGITADVVLSCLIDGRGTFQTCEVVEETPAGLGFGESTIRLARIFRMKPVDADGALVAGRRLRLPVRWYAGLRP
jgi:protein TonB